MKKNYTAPQSTALKFFPEESVMVGLSNSKGNCVQLSNKKEATTDKDAKGNSTWNSGLWSYDSDK